MWQFLLLAAVGAGTGYFAKCIKHRTEANVVGGEHGQHQGNMWFSYGVGVGVMLMISTGKCELNKLSALLNEVAGSVEELKRQFDARKVYVQDDEMQDGVCHPEFPLQIDARCPVNYNSCFVETPFEENESAGSVITVECAQVVNGMAELEEEFQEELAHIQVDLLKLNSSKHQRNISEFSESSIAVVEGGLCTDGLPGHCSSSENEMLEVPLDVSHGNDYGVSPYELDRHLRDFVEKQQQEKILELEMKLKSMESNLRAKEREFQQMESNLIELQQWKNHVRYLAEDSLGATTSGEDSSTVMKGSKNLETNCSLKSIVCSAQKGVSQPQWWMHDQCPLESTAESPEQFDYRGKMASSGTGLTMPAHFEGMEQTSSVCNFGDTLDRSYIDFLNGLVDVGSSACHNESDGSFTKSIDQRSCEMFDKVSEASSCCILLDHS